MSLYIQTLIDKVNMKQPSRFTLVFMTVMFLYIFTYVVHVNINPKYPFDGDLSLYVTVLVQEENPELFRRDPVYQDGYITRLYWSSSYAYLKLFTSLYNITQQNISTTIALLHLIPAFALFLTFYWLLRAFPLDRWLCLMFAVGLSYWLIVERSTGTPTAFYYVCVPVFLRLLWQFLVEPSLQDRPVILWRVTATGMMIGVSAMLINSVNGLIFSSSMLILVTIQLLARRMQWQPYTALIVGLLPFLFLAVLGGTGGAIQDDGTALFLFNNLPTGTLNATLYIMSTKIEIFDAGILSFLFYIPLLGLIAGLSILLWYTQHPTRLLKMIFVSVSALFWLWILGNIGIVLYLYFLSRFWRGRETSLDYVFITGLSVGVFIGPALLWILALVWKVTHWHSLVFIMWQMFRFHRFTYFIAATALVFMIEYLTHRINTASLRYLIQVIFILALGLQPMQMTVISVSFLCLLAMMLIFIRLSFSSNLLFADHFVTLHKMRTIARPRTLLISTMVSIIMLLAFWINSSLMLHPLSVFPTNRDSQPSKNRMEEDYMDMTEWLRLNSPLDSLIHFAYEYNDDNGFFRFLTQRALFFDPTDEIVGQFSPGLAARNRQLLKDITDVPLVFIGSVLLKYQVDYIVIRSANLPPLPARDKGDWSVPVPVYSNTTYVIYQMQNIN